MLRRINLDKKDDSPNFIGAWFIEPVGLCDEIVAFFDFNRARHSAGKMANGVQDERLKKTTDITIRPSDIPLETHSAINQYIEAFLKSHNDLRSILLNIPLPFFVKR